VRDDMAHPTIKIENYPDSSSLRRVWVQNGNPTYEYYSDAREFLYYRNVKGNFVFVALRGRWFETAPPDPVVAPALASSSSAQTRTKMPSANAGALRTRGKWLPPIPALPAHPPVATPTAQDPTPTPALGRLPQAFTFTFSVQVAGIHGEMTITVTSLRDAKMIMDEIRLAATQDPSLGIYIG
jgi:hypothetical protein